MKNENALKFIDTIQAGLCENMKGLKIIDKKVDGIMHMLQNFYGMNVPSYIPDMTGRQIYKCIKMGWSTQQLMAISGYSEEELQKKYKSYVEKNV